MAKQSTARDVFMYLLVLVVLMMSTISLGALLFDFVNIYLPDTALYSPCSYDGCASAVNTEIAVLIVAFPVLVWAWRYLQRDLKQHPEKADYRVRKWLLYLTLFASGITTLVDLIGLITAWLNGELTLQFSLKVLSILLIAATTFFYFLKELHEERSGRQAYIAWGATVVVVASLVLGVYTSAPWNAHARSVDRDRVFALQNIQGEIINFWMAKSRLPVTLAELSDPVRGFVPPTDPETMQPYEYARLDSKSFRLCAIFTTAILGGGYGKDTVPMPANGPRGDLYSSNWDHGVGRTCFERVIDPQLYPPK